MFQRVGHIAVLTADTERSLALYRDTLGLSVLLGEELPGIGVRLTHLDLGNLALQLVEPLTPDHPLRRELEERGEGLHHLCSRVDSVEEAMATLPDCGLATRPGEPHPARPGGAGRLISSRGPGMMPPPR